MYVWPIQYGYFSQSRLPISFLAKSDVGDNVMLVTFSIQKIGITVSNLSPTESVSIIRHQH